MFFFPESSHDISSSDFHHKNIFFCISALVSWASSDAWQCVVPFVEAPSLRYLKPSLGQDGTQQGSTRLAAGSGVSWWFWNKNSPTKDIPKHVGWWNIYSIYIYISPSPFCPPFSWLCLNGTSWWVERQHHHLVALEPLRHQQSGLQVEICKAQGDLKGLPSPCPTMHEHPKHMLYYIP